MMALGLRSPASAQAYPVKPISYHRAVCGRRHHRRHRPRAGTAARRGLGSTGRDREQAGRGHRPGRHRIRRAIRTRRLHALVTADATFVTCLIPTASCRTTPSTTSCRSPASASARRRWSFIPRCRCARSETWSITPGRDQASSIAEPSALDRADISTSFCWKA